VALGFDPDRLLTFDLVMPRRILGTETRWPEQQRVMAALQQTPGVMSATFANQLAPSPGCMVGNVFIDGRPPGPDQRSMCLTLTTADFFTVMRIPLRAGRLWTAADTEQAESLTALISETAARTYWPGRNPIGASGRLGGPNGFPFEVVGVVGDVHNNGANKPPDPELYLTAKPRVLAFNPMSVIVRSDVPVEQVFGAVRRSIRQTDPTLVMEDVSTMNDIVHQALQLERVSSLVMTFFGMVALLMATLGIYSVVSYFVRQRTMELGTRMALGAVNRDLVALVLGGGLKLSLAGLAVGSVALVGGVWLLVRVLEVADIGWLPFASSAAVVALVSGAAASVPAWRTTLISPMAAMREQPPSVWRWVRLRMVRAARDVREAVVGTDDRDTDISAAGVLTAFVDAARTADSYAEALRAALASVCNELRVESAALLERRDAAQTDYTCLAAVGTLQATVPAVPADGFLITRLRAHPQPLPLAATELAALAEWAAEHRPDRVDEIRALAAAGVRLAVPLRTRREILGVLLLGGRPFGSPAVAQGRRGGFSAQERQALRVGADQFALMIENGRLTDRVVEQETLRRDIALASEVQRRLLPEAPPLAESADFAAVSVPARRIGGDYYDFIELHDGAIGIALADVSGKGVAAALIMSVVQASLRIISSEGEVLLPNLVARMNEFVYRSTPSSKYATFFYARFDGQRRQLRYVNAGHNPPYLFRAGRASGSEPALPVIEELSTGGTVVGMFPEMGYEEATVDLLPGDVLLIFTDGVPEAHNPANEEFGEERLQQLLRTTAHLPADEISARISAETKDWIRDAEQYDDLTFIVMKVR
jgi:serine phosphatase RsbU (regulator of sigma subunit)